MTKVSFWLASAVCVVVGVVTLVALSVCAVLFIGAMLFGMAVPSWLH